MSVRRESTKKVSNLDDRNMKRGVFGGVTKPIVMFYSPQPLREYQYGSAINLRLVKDIKNTIVVGKGEASAVLSQSFLKSELFTDLIKIHNKDPAALQTSFTKIQHENKQLKEELSSIKKKFAMVPLQLSKTKLMKEVMEQYKRNPEKLSKVSLEELFKTKKQLENELDRTRNEVNEPAVKLCEKCKVIVEYENIQFGDGEYDEEDTKFLQRKSVRHQSIRALRQSIIQSRKSGVSLRSAMGPNEELIAYAHEISKRGIEVMVQGADGSVKYVPNPGQQLVGDEITPGSLNTIFKKKASFQKSDMSIISPFDQNSNKTDSLEKRTNDIQRKSHFGQAQNQGALTNQNTDSSPGKKYTDNTGSITSGTSTAEIKSESVSGRQLPGQKPPPLKATISSKKDVAKAGPDDSMKNELKSKVEKAKKELEEKQIKAQTEKLGTPPTSQTSKKEVLPSKNTEIGKTIIERIDEVEKADKRKSVLLKVEELKLEEEKIMHRKSNRLERDNAFIEEAIRADKKFALANQGRHLSIRDINEQSRVDEFGPTGEKANRLRSILSNIDCKAISGDIEDDGVMNNGIEQQNNQKNMEKKINDLLGASGDIPEPPL